MSPKFSVGIARSVITPAWGVELAGLGYYLQRKWETVRDDLTATALVVSAEDSCSAAIVAVDMMYNSGRFTREVRRSVAANTDIRPSSICVNFSHTHNAPTAGLALGLGQRDHSYLRYAARQAATAVIMAWRRRKPARLFTGAVDLPGLTYNRTRENGPVDTLVSVLRAEAESGQPIAFMVNFHGHPCAHMQVDLRAVSRDVPGEVVDQLEAISPGAIAMYLQGTCGDVNFRPEYLSTDRRFEVARAVTNAALQALAHARPVETPGVTGVSNIITLPTRRWTLEQIHGDRNEGLYRLRSGDTAGWLDGIGRVIVNEPARLPERYGGSVEKAVGAVSRFAVEWTDRILPWLDVIPEWLSAEVQGIRIGDVYLAAHGSELFTTLGLDLRKGWPRDDLFVLGYSNLGIGYMPDRHDIERRSYAAVTSPKFTGHFPFTPESGPILVRGLLAALQRTEAERKFGENDHI